MGCVIIFTPPLCLQRQEPHIGLRRRFLFGALNTMDKKRKYSELNSNGGGAIYGSGAAARFAFGNSRQFLKRLVKLKV